MAQYAVTSMSHAKKPDETEEEEAKETLILTILTVILAIVPFVGEVGAASAGLAGNAAMDTDKIVEDPVNAIVGVFGLLLGIGGVMALGRRGGVSYAEMGKMRRGKGAEEIAKLG